MCQATGLAQFVAATTRLCENLRNLRMNFRFAGIPGRARGLAGRVGPGADGCGLVCRALVGRALVGRALVGRALVCRALVCRALVCRALVCRALVGRGRRGRRPSRSR